MEAVRAGAPPGRPPGGTGRSRPLNQTWPREQFEANVARIIEYIRAGDAYQVVPSQRWSAPVPVEAFSIYRGLRAVNPSPYMYFLDFGDFEIAGASPGAADHGQRPHASPPGRSPAPGRAAPTCEEDRRLAEELLADEKERAEHVMLVDLGRNDLGRVCEYGSVAVEEFMAVENYSHVMHIVSSVTGRLREGVERSDALRVGAAGRNAVRRAQGPGDADHRRARAGQARRLRGRDRLGQLRRRPRHLHPHPHGGDQGRRRPRPGRRRHGRRRQAGRTSTRSRWPSRRPCSRRSSWPPRSRTGRSDYRAKAVRMGRAADGGRERRRGAAAGGDVRAAGEAA